jgi:hypothetical protein
MIIQIAEAVWDRVTSLVGFMKPGVFGEFEVVRGGTVLSLFSWRDFFGIFSFWRNSVIQIAEVVWDRVTSLVVLMKPSVFGEFEVVRGEDISTLPFWRNSVIQIAEAIWERVTSLLFLVRLDISKEFKGVCGGTVLSFLESLHYTDYLRLSVKVRFALHLDSHFGNLFTFFRSKKENTVRGEERECMCVRLLTAFANATSSGVNKGVLVCG